MCQIQFELFNRIYFKIGYGDFELLFWSFTNFNYSKLELFST